MKAKAQVGQGNAGGWRCAPDVQDPPPTFRQGRRKRAARKSVHPIFLSYSESDEEVDLATYRQYRWECRRLRRENKQMRETAAVHTSVVEKSLLVAGLRSELKHVKNLLQEANLRTEQVHEELKNVQQSLAMKETRLAALRRGWQAKIDEIITSSLRIGTLEERVERLRNEAIPHLYQTTLTDPDAGKKLVEKAADPNVRVAELCPSDVDGSNSG